MNQDELKRLVGRAALAHVSAGAVIGVGTGSTVDCFIDALAAGGPRIAGAVSSSLRSTARLEANGIRVFEADEVESLPVYIDGAAALAERFVCIADGSKLVDVLGRFPLPVEVVPMAAAQIARRFAALGGEARLREGVLTDNGQQLLDVHGLRIDDPLGFEREVNQWPGVVTVGVFARHRATLCLLGTPEGVRTLAF